MNSGVFRSWKAKNPTRHLTFSVPCTIYQLVSGCESAHQTDSSVNVKTSSWAGEWSIYLAGRSNWQGCTSNFNFNNLLHLSQIQTTYLIQSIFLNTSFPPSSYPRGSLVGYIKYIDWSSHTVPQPLSPPKMLFHQIVVTQKECLV